MPESKIIHESKQCPTCHCKETVANKAFEVAEMKFPTGAFVSLDKGVIPLSQPALAVATVPSIIVHYDVCIKCGTRYSTRSEVVKLPIQAPMPGKPPFMAR